MRVVQNATKTVEQRNDYYPFGLTHSTPSNLQKNKYLYNGKEIQDEVLANTAFNELDYEAHFYDPIIARWLVRDPQAEKFSSFTQYNYCKNDPINRIDPDGEADYRIDKYGAITLVKKQSSQAKASSTDRLIHGNFKYDKKTGDLIADPNTYVEVNKNSDGKSVFEEKKEIKVEDRITGEPNTTTMLDFGANTNEAEKVFKFIANNVTVEFGYVQRQTSDNRIINRLFTSNKTDKIALPIDESGYASGDILKYIHNHFEKPGKTHEQNQAPSPYDEAMKKLYETTSNPLYEALFQIYYNWNEYKY